MADDRTPAQAATTAFAALDRIIDNLPLLYSHASAMASVASGTVVRPSALDADMSREAVEAIAFWSGALREALCDIQLGLPGEPLA